MKFDPKELRSAFGSFMTGVTVVTTVDADGNCRGFTANSFTSVSLDPPLLAICVANAAHSADEFRHADGFAVNILGSNQIEVSNLFASKRADKFAVSKWTAGPAGHPVLDGVVTWFDCVTDKIVEAGDHFIMIGEVRAMKTSDQDPLGFARGGYFAVDRERNVAASTASTIVGVSAIVERNEQLWLDTDREGRAILPRRELRRGEGAIEAIQEMLRIRGCAAHVSYLFAIYDREDGTGQEIVYRAQARDNAATLTGFRSFEDALRDVAHDPVLTRILTRYCNEHAVQGFGIYFGAVEGGTVQRLAT